MKITKYIPHIIFISLGAAFAYGAYTLFFTHKEERLFSTRQPEVRPLTKVVRATGKVNPDDLMKIGSIIIGVIDEMFVEENEFVKKGQLLVTIDDGKDDTDVRATKAVLASAKAYLDYYMLFYSRQKSLHEGHFISDNDFDKYTSELKRAQEDVNLRQAQFDQASLLFNRKKIVAPDDGIIVGKNSSEGETVTSYAPATIIYTIAKNIKKMKAEVEIDESSIGQIKKGMEAELTFDTYLGRVFKSTITDLSNNPIEKGGAICYKATLPIDNSQMLFRPGMTVTAEIVVAEKAQALTVRGQQFAIKPAIIEQIAKVNGYGFKPLSKEARAKYEKLGDHKIVWIEENKNFIERPVKIGVSDGAFYEIVDGLKATDLVVEDTIEENALAKVFSKMFGAGMK